MKKTLSLLLAVLMIFSVCSFTLASAEGEAATVKIIFYDYDNTVIEEKMVVPGGKFTGPAAAPARPNEVKDDVEYVYTFKGWAKLVDGVADESQLYYTQTFDFVEEDTQYIAVYSVEEREPIMTFWNLIEMIFSKFNEIFEYFFKIFG